MNTCLRITYCITFTCICLYSLTQSALNYSWKSGFKKTDLLSSAVKRMFADLPVIDVLHERIRVDRKFSLLHFEIR